MVSEESNGKKKLLSLITQYSIVGENDETLFLDVVNEDPSRPGLIGSAKLPLSSVFESGIFENWVPLVASTGQPLGHIYMKLAFTVSLKK